ncbi:hypothetical protein [Sunxiuqinia dokdonensis]|uniref:Uncharacterized protein n=1 Tax=Sunxiuqinia dokdonensis TaxID=1409788 RepID=A0A0L8VBM0_9BACT|nr:hypothetical protein [Sunxiuqinia dokdonensis]KOH45738.1 hypothetical protein NC99_14450 [Sunxiuqinia dokdonensis]
MPILNFGIYGETGKFPHGVAAGCCLKPFGLSSFSVCFLPLRANGAKAPGQGNALLFEMPV